MDRKISYKSLWIIAYNLSKLYRDGIGIVKAFELLEELPLKKRYKESLKLAKKSIEKGNGISESFSMSRELYPSFFIRMIKLGEETGNLEKVLESLGKYYKSKEEYKQKTIESLIYPLFICIFLFFGIIATFLFLIPMVGDLISNFEELPVITKVGLNVSEFLNENKIIGLMYIVMIMIILPGSVFYLKKDEIKNFLKEKIKILKKRREYRILVSISVLVESGINIKVGVEYLIETEDKEMKEAYVIFRDELEKGMTIEKALRKSNKISEYSLAIINIGEESGSLDKRLKKLVQELDEENKKIEKRLMNSIQPIAILTVGVFFLLFVVTFIVPIIKSVYGVIN
ncbi:MAG: type II secretion system F family protein [Clostridium sp.]|uniref:type II secretion system F family protein n=1 Tax=Clostridium sp. TaxID=1506 RepID=UPI003F3EDB53